MLVVVGSGVTGVIIFVFSSNSGALEACAKEHNVYACEWVAVPVKGIVGE